MNDESRSSSDRISAVIRAYLQAVEEGDAPDQDALLAEHEDLADELRAFFANDAWLKQCTDEGTVGDGHGSDAVTIPPSSQPSSAPAPRPGEIPEGLRQFGDYELLEEIARGGMGVVYKARQISLNRIVALKMILTGQLSSEQDLQRFLAEAEAAAHLEHPGIVPIYEVGERNGQHYFSMGFVDGHSLAEQIKDGPLPATAAVQFVKRVAEAMAFAHEQGVIHRDLKPGNVLVGRDGQPRVADFGLAKRVEHDSGLTTSGQILGTPSYMPPEQASGDPTQVGERSDVYAMGAILYALLTGRPPFQAANPLDTILQLTMQDPVSPRQLNQQISRDLETICLKCLEKDPARRYASAQALADELQCVINGEPIKARPLGKVGRGLRWCRRNPALAASLAAAVVFLFGGIVVSTFFAIQSYRRELLARSNELQAFHNLYAANLNLAQAAWNDANVPRVIELLRYFRPSSPDQIDLRGWEWYYMWRLCHADYQTLQGHTGVVFSLAYSPDGTILATATDDTIRLWEVSSRRLLRTLQGHRDMVTVVAFHPQGKLLASGSTDGTARVWDVAQGTEVARFDGHTAVVRGVVFHGEQLVATCSTAGEVSVWRIDDGQQQFSFSTEGEPIYSVAISADGRLLAAAGDSGAIRTFDLQSREPLHELTGHEGAVLRVAFDRDTARLVSAGTDRTVRVWNAESGHAERVLRGHSHAVRDVAIARDGQRIASASSDRTIKVWDAESGQELRTLKGHQFAVYSLALNSSGTQLASGGLDATVRFWDLTTTPDRRAMSAHQGAVRCTAWHPLNDTRMASADDRGQIVLWDTSTAEPLQVLDGHAGPVNDLCFSPDGKQLVSAGEDRCIRIWNIEEESSTTLATLDASVWSLAFHPDGRRLAAGGRDALIHIFDMPERKEIAVLAGHLSFVLCLDFSSDGQLLASGGQDSTLRLWDVAEGSEVATLYGHDSYVLDVAFDPSSSLLATASQDNSTILWDVASRQMRFRFKGHNNFVVDVDFGRRGKRLASAGLDGAVKIWDCDSGQEVLSLENHDGPALCVDFNRLGNHLASGGEDRRILVYDGTPHEQAEFVQPTASDAQITAAQRSLLAKTPYEFGWAAGSANAEDELATSFYPVTSIELQGNQVSIVYAWKDGVIRGQLRGQEIYGTWIQTNGRGEMYLRFDEQFQKATGWWNEGGETPRHAAFLRPTN